MTTPMQSGTFGDVLDPRFQRMFFEEKKQLTSMIPQVYTVIPSNGRNNMTFSDVGTLSDWVEFTGNVDYTSMAQGYDTTMTWLEFTKGIQVERKLYDDQQFHIFDQRPKNMVTSGHRKREKDAARIFNNAFSNDTYFYSNSEGVALCSNSHTTNATGVSTATGFDNLVTAALSPTAVFAARLQMLGFKDDVGEIYDVNPDELWYPPDLSETAFEIVKSAGKVDTTYNNRNFNEGRYKLNEHRRLTDANNWFLSDSAQRKMYLFWCDRVAMEFAFVEDFDTLVAKWRGYMRYSLVYTNWRWLIGSQVT